MKVLLTGANGQLGLCIQDRFPASWTLKATKHSELDITCYAQLVTLIESFKPDFIINAAAYTAVDKAEQEPERADLVNNIAAKYLSELTREYTIRLIHISTDYVFDGKNKKHYLETDKAYPINVYGQTKLLGEQAVLANDSSAIILRTSWVFSEYGNNFVKTMLKLVKDRKELSVVADQFGKPTYAGDLAQAIITIIKDNNMTGGIYHYSGDNPVSWFEFAKTIFDQANKMKKLAHPVIVNPLTTQQYPTLAKRPKYSIMDNNKILKYGLMPSNWHKALTTVIECLKN